MTGGERESEREREREEGRKGRTQIIARNPITFVTELTQKKEKKKEWSERLDRRTDGRATDRSSLDGRARTRSAHFPLPLNLSSCKVATDRKMPASSGRVKGTGCHRRSDFDRLPKKIQVFQVGEG